MSAPRISRRRFAGRAAAAAAGTALAARCGGAARTLHVFNWADYIDPRVVGQFERTQGCRVAIDTFDSNESLYAKLKAGGGGYDVLVPSSYMAKVMWSQGLLQPLDRAKLPNVRAIDPEYLRVALDPAMRYSVPYMLTNSGIAFLPARTGPVAPSWAAFGRTDLKGRMTLLNDMRETLGAALKLLGHSLNTRAAREVEAARDVVIGWKKNIARFESEQYRAGLASGEFLLVHGYSGDVLQLARERADVAFTVPLEGTSIACDDLVIPKGAPDPDLAHRFIEFLNEPDVAARNSNFIRFVTANAAARALLDPALARHPAVTLDPEVRAKSEVIDDLGADNALYVKAWDAVKAAS